MARRLRLFVVPPALSNRRLTSRRLVAGLLGLGFAARLAYGWMVPPQPVPGPVADIDGYVTLASSFAHDWTFSIEGRPSAQREPAYPVFLGLLFKVFGNSYRVFLLAQCLLGVAALGLLYAVGKSLFGDGIALTAVGIAAVYPPFIYYAVRPYRETMMVLVGTASVCLLMRAYRRGRTALFAASGAVCAVGALTSTVLAPFGLLAPSLLFFLPGAAFRRALKWTAAHLAAFVLLYSLWPLRNYQVFKTWIIGCTATGGSTFYTYMVVPQEVGGTARQEEFYKSDPVLKQGAALPSEEREKFFWKAGARWALDHPGRYLRLFAWRFFWDEWRLWPRPRAYDHSYRLLKWASILTDGWIIPLGFIGVALAGAGIGEGWWIYLFVLSLSAVYAVLLTMLRYRLPSMPWLILFASAGLHQIAGRLRRHPAP